MKQAKLILEVMGGLSPGVPIDEYTRMWSLTSEEAKDPNTLLDAQGAAMNYCLWLQNPQRVNWVRLEWIWL